MRKITELCVEAFKENRNFKLSNTEITVKNGKTKMFLFGNLIAEKEGGKLFITNAGWESNTTKERLNGLPNVNIYQKSHVWYLNGKEWNGNFTEV